MWFPKVYPLSTCAIIRPLEVRSPSPKKTYSIKVIRDINKDVGEKDMVEILSPLEFSKLIFSMFLPVLTTWICFVTSLDTSDSFSNSDLLPTTIIEFSSTSVLAR